jgi:hypothetical protein
VVRYFPIFWCYQAPAVNPSFKKHPRNQGTRLGVSVVWNRHRIQWFRDLKFNLPVLANARCACSLSLNFTCSGSLECYYWPLSTYQVSNIPKDYCISNSLPKTAKSQNVLHWCLGVNWGWVPRINSLWSLISSKLGIFLHLQCTLKHPLHHLLKYHIFSLKLFNLIKYLQRPCVTFQPPIMCLQRPYITFKPLKLFPLQTWFLAFWPSELNYLKKLGFSKTLLKVGNWMSIKAR